ncbi:hypothetical protein [uncultured Gilvimarinus sp.]|uniref:hypothetical protein n=1 Tax=uncultured Gilvimarinus sp. TaxID=1689143 RepID=UPI0030EC5E83|tara:strand:- start:1333 stop:1752 length:420 start_codon:yes stop_codon:yes gene_type:complete
MGIKARFKIEKEFDIAKVLIDVYPSHIGDSDDDDMPTDFPGLDESKTNWRAVVDVETGQIEGWLQGDSRDLHIKVCDAGSYTLYDASGDSVQRIVNGYVPNNLIPGEYGDYIILKIDQSGVITNWPKTPSFEDFQPDED